MATVEVLATPPPERVERMTYRRSRISKSAGEMVAPVGIGVVGCCSTNRHHDGRQHLFISICVCNSFASEVLSSTSLSSEEQAWSLFFAVIFSKGSISNAI